MSDLTKTPLQIIFDEIIAANPTSTVTINDYDLGAPSEEEGAKNTSIVATAKLTSSFTGEQTFYYDRVDLDAPGTYANSLGPIPKTDEITTIGQIVAHFNALTGVALTEDDYTASAFPTFTNTPDEEHTVTLTATPESLVWIGATTLTLKLLKVALVDALPVNTLNGLTYVPPGG